MPDLQVVLLGLGLLVIAVLSVFSVFYIAWVAVNVAIAMWRVLLTLLGHPPSDP